MTNDWRKRLVDFTALTLQRPPATPRLLRRDDSDLVDLQGKRILVTGSSAGIGAAAAVKFAELGAHVVLVARRKDLLDALVGQIAASGGSATAYPCDLGDLAAIDELVARVESDHGGIDILINNAAHSIRRPLAESLDRWHDVERMIALNYYAPLRLMRGLAPGMRERRDGHIINVATWGVLMESPPLFGVYNASKAALSSISRIAETEWFRFGVHSTTIFYPLVKTAMSAPTRAFENRTGLSAEEAADWMVTAAQTRPIRIAPRIGLAAHAINSFRPAAIDGFMKRRLSK